MEAKEDIVMLYYIVFILAGYLLGGILFAPIFGRMLKKRDILAETKDGNPGTANAFMEGGPLCGTLTLVCDMGKGFLPVFLCRCLERPLGELLWRPGEWLWRGRPEIISTLGMALVLLAPVLGHNFSVYHHFQGGKGIATSFGCLLGYWPDLSPALLLAAIFLLFSLVIRISPHFYRTLGTYVCGAGMFFVWGETLALKLGFLFISIAVCVRMHLSTEERKKCNVRLLWMH
ncbi:MAG: glycerol-3-phosphate acyltransferase [Roseburia sp.]|nr:glycerol-3-phosphate acyltransferase [Roseburia sp.]